MYGSVASNLCNKVDYPVNYDGMWGCRVYIIANLTLFTYLFILILEVFSADYILTVYKKKQHFKLYIIPYDK